MAGNLPTSSSHDEHPTTQTFHGNTSQGNSRNIYGNVYGGQVNHINGDTRDKQLEDYRDVLRWLNAPDPTNDHYEAQRRYEKDTGAWFLESKELEDWTHGIRSLLWLYGPPGCCKTILCSAAIEQTKCRASPDSRVILYYFTFRDSRKQNYGGFLSSIVAQLLDKHDIPESLFKARDMNQSHYSALEHVAKEVIRQYPLVHLLIDGLDECPDTGGRGLVLEGLRSLTGQCPNLKLLVTSRKERDIEYFMIRELGTNSFAVPAKLVNKDIELHVKRELERHSKLRTLSKDMKAYVSEDLARKAGGMFRWVNCQLETLRKLRTLRPRYVEEVLQDLPRTLDETYDRMLLQLGHGKEVLSILQWVAFNRGGGISFVELREACMTDYQQEPYVDESSRTAIGNLIWDMSSLLRFESYGDQYSEDEESGDSEHREQSEDEEITDDERTEEENKNEDQGHASSNGAEPTKVAACQPDSMQKAVGSREEDDLNGSSPDYLANLDKIDPGNRDLGQIRVSFAHRSVEEYLTSGYIKQGPAAIFYLDKDLSNYHLAQTCMAYILHVELEVRRRTAWSVSQSESHNHVGAGQTIYRQASTQHFFDDLEEWFPLLRHSLDYWANYQISIEFPLDTEHPQSLALPVLQAFSKSTSLVDMSLNTFSRSGYPDCFSTTALILASCASPGWFTLVAAAGFGLSETLKALMSDMPPYSETTIANVGLALLAACFTREAVPKELANGLLRMADRADNAMQTSCEQLHLLAAKLSSLSEQALASWSMGSLGSLAWVLQHYSLLDHAQSYLVNALRLSVFNYRPDAIEILCEAGVDANIDMMPRNGPTALQFACTKSSFSSVADALLKHGAYPNLPEHGVRPLWYAVSLEKEDLDGRHELDDAVRKVEVLLKAGADPNSGRDDGARTETALQAASRIGADEIVEILLKAGARHDFVIEPYGTELEIEWSVLKYFWEWTKKESKDIIRDFLNGSGIFAGRRACCEYAMGTSRLPNSVRPSLGLQTWRNFAKEKRWPWDHRGASAVPDQANHKQDDATELD